MTTVRYLGVIGVLAGFGSVAVGYNRAMDVSRRTWIAAVKLAVVLSTCAAFITVVVSAFGDVAPLAIVAPVAIVAFTASWVQTGRVQRSGAPIRISSH